MEYAKLKENTLVVTQEPLAGATLSNLLRLFVQNKFKIDFRYMPRAVYSLTLSSLLFPLRLIEHVKFEKAVEKTEIKHDPVFIIGHWRSGTTYLHNVLSLDENLGYLTTFSAFVPSLCLEFEKFFKPFVSRSMPKKRPMDDVRIDADLPQEEEYAIAALSPFSIHHSTCFPRNTMRYNKFAFLKDMSKETVEEWEKIYLHILKKLTLKNNGRQLVLKNPSNTARVKLLLEMFPDAKFIHIYRDPYSVYSSMMNFLTIVGPLYCLQKPPSMKDLEKQVLTIYKKMYMKYFEEKGYIPNGNLIEIKYEDFIQHPLQNIKKIYNDLSLKDYKKSENAFMKYIDGQHNFYKNKHDLDENIKRKISSKWKFAFLEFGYEI